MSDMSDEELIERALARPATYVPVLAERLRARIEALEALVEEAAEWSRTYHEEDEYGWRHCCDTADFKPHADGCKFSAARAALEQR